MTTSFDQLDLIEPLVAALKREGIIQPTAIQEKVIPSALENRDILGQSETGTGKTLAYLLPILQKVDPKKREAQAIILSPTHELAIQIQRQIEILVKNSGLEITVALIIGSVNISRQIEKLKEKPHILVGSSGRILELIKKKKINAQTIRTIVIDEADRLLDDNNAVAVKAVIKTTLRDRQLMLFSATLTEGIMKQLAQTLKNPEFIKVTQKVKTAPNIKHMYLLAEQRDKFEILRKLIRMLNPTRALIFINKSEEIKIIVEKLKYHGLEAEGLHGSSKKDERRTVMEEFRTGKVSLLVASDLAARGLDIKDVSHVFNIDFPEDPQLYLHRVGRTGRAGLSGIAISIVNLKELFLLEKVEKTFKIAIIQQDLSMGKITSVKKKPVLNMRKKDIPAPVRGNRQFPK
jgi:Superfamily II DNA and RNA helicases